VGARGAAGPAAAQEREPRLAVSACVGVG
jgi:hypothetical protein